MASRDCAISSGAICSALGFRAYTRDCAIRAGTSISIVRPPWAGKSAKRRAADWLPRPDEPLLDARSGNINARWYKFFFELANRLGGIDGDSLSAVVERLLLTQAQADSTLVFTQQVGQFAAGVQAQTQALSSAAAVSGVDTASVPPPEPMPEYHNPKDYLP